MLNIARAWFVESWFNWILTPYNIYLYSTIYNAVVEYMLYKDCDSVQETGSNMSVHTSHQYLCFPQPGNFSSSTYKLGFWIQQKVQCSNAYSCNTSNEKTNFYKLQTSSHELILMSMILFRDWKKNLWLKWSTVLYSGNQGYLLPQVMWFLITKAQLP